jgi:uncharacterized protein YqeY
MRVLLTQAMKARDEVATSALRSALAAIDNAEAVDVAPSTHLAAPERSTRIAGAVSGVGAAEVSRRALTPHDIEALISAEISQRREAAEQYDRLGSPERAARLRGEADVLANVLA